MMRIFLVIDIILFVSAALIHSGVLVTGYVHYKARIAEGVIALVLFSGLIIGLIHPAWVRSAGLAVQWFALFGTLVGLFTIAIGVGPRTKLDLVIHSMMLMVLVAGLVFSH